MAIDFHQPAGATVQAQWRLAVANAMVPFVTLVEEWGRFDQAAFDWESRVQRGLDGYCDGLRAAPALADQAVARRQRYIAQHRLRWILFQIGQRRDGVPRI